MPGDSFILNINNRNVGVYSDSSDVLERALKVARKHADPLNILVLEHKMNNTRSRERVAFEEHVDPTRLKESRLYKLVLKSRRKAARAEKSEVHPEPAEVPPPRQHAAAHDEKPRRRAQKVRAENEPARQQPAEVNIEPETRPAPARRARRKAPAESSTDSASALIDEVLFSGGPAPRRRRPKPEPVNEPAAPAPTARKQRRKHE